MYSLITVIVGIVFAVVGLFNIVRSVMVRESLITQIAALRFVLSGALFIFHSKITSHFGGVFSDFLASYDIPISETMAFWVAVIMLAAVQSVVIPSWGFLSLSRMSEAWGRR